MEIKSEQKHILISPRKVRPVADIIKKMSPLTSLEKLPFIKKRGAEFLLKVVKSAIAKTAGRKPFAPGRGQMEGEAAMVDEYEDEE